MASAFTFTTQSNEVLLLQKEIFTIYLEPLLKIHNNNIDNPTTTSNSNVITYEDLTSSFQLAVASLGKLQTNVDVNGKNFVVRDFPLVYQSSKDVFRIFILVFSLRRLILLIHSVLSLVV